MRCTSTYLGKRCSLSHGHRFLHLSTDGRDVWSDCQADDFVDGFEVPLHEEEDPEGPITSVIQYYVPIPHVVISRKPISRKQRNCKRCYAAGVIYDPMTAEQYPCPSCQPRVR